MRCVLFLGPPGVGKGTQCALLSQRLGFTHLSTGAIIRREIASGSALGVRVKTLVDQGGLVDDATVLSCLEQALSSLQISKDAVVMLDGCPRNLAQAISVEPLLEKIGATLERVISFQADLADLVERFASRVNCSSCGWIGSLSPDVDLKTKECGACHTVGTLYRRNDDSPASVEKRFMLYRAETEPLIAFYEKKGLLYSINGLASKEDVYAKVASIL